MNRLAHDASMLASAALLALALAAESHADAGIDPAPPAAGQSLASGIPGRELNLAQIGVRTAPDRRTAPLVLMLDGAADEDFPWVAEQLRQANSRGELPALVLVGLGNAERRFDLTPASADAEDVKMIPRNGGADRTFADLKDRLLPLLVSTLDSCGPRVLMGESLAGLFVLDAYRKDPALFDAYLAFDPSAWWNAHGIVAQLRAMPEPSAADGRVSLVSGVGVGNIDSTRRVHEALRGPREGRVTLDIVEGEDHGSIYRSTLVPTLVRALAAAGDVDRCDSGPTTDGG